LEASREQLRALAAHLQSLTERERISISREIHDELGQALTAAKINLTMIERDIMDEGESLNPSQLLPEIESTKALLDVTIKKMKNLISELRPEMLDDLGLIPVLEWQLQEFEKRTGLECVCQCTILPAQELANVQSLKGLFRFHPCVVAPDCVRRTACCFEGRSGRIPSGAASGYSGRPGKTVDY
jgi:two-component system sensor histidine kinase UhpB